MFRSLIIAVFLAGLLTVLGDIAPNPAAAKSMAAVSDVRVGLHGARTRVVLDLNQAVEFSIFTLPAPYRVVINLPEVNWALAAQNLPENKGLIGGLRFGLFSPGTSRMVIDAKGPVEVQKAFLLKPIEGNRYRLVLDLVSTSQTVFLETLAHRKAQAKASQPARVQAVAMPMPMRKPDLGGKKIIVIDPGHGGVDPGTIGVSRTYEKNVTLALARDIKKALEATGRFKVVLTRDRDIFIRLRDRVRKAREAGADLFISVHADSVKNRRTRGLSIYTLSDNASDKEAAALAHKENKADLIAGIDLSAENAEVTNILIDLAQRETMNQSAIIAQGLVKELKREVKLLRNTHRFAGFAVLKAPDLPSVLVEAGFLSNAQDERNLLSRNYRTKMARAFARGVLAHFDNIQEAKIR